MSRTIGKFGWLKPLALAVLLLCGTTAGLADDTEVYYTGNGSGGHANILLLIDNSAGTHQTFKGSPSYGAGKTIDQIVYALDEVINNLSGNARIGVASQIPGGGSGGAINYPVVQINQKVSPFASSQVTQTTGIAGQSYTVATTPSPTNAAVWGTFSATGTLPFPSGISPSSPSNGLGLLLSNLKVPRYASIISATLTLNTPTTGTSTVYARVASEQVSQPAPYATGATTDLSARSWSLPFDYNSANYNSANSTYNANGSLGNNQITLNVTSAVQAAVAQPVWCGGQDLSLLVETSNLSSASVYSETAKDANGVYLGGATLNVQWSGTASVPPPSFATGNATMSCMGGLVYALNSNAADGTETTKGTNLQTSGTSLVLNTVTSGPSSNRGTYVGGLRFSGVGLPAGAQVQSATLKGNISAVSGSSPMLSVVPMMGSTSPFTTSGSIGQATTGSTSASIPAVVGPFSMDVTSLVNAILSSSGWAAGGAMGFQLSNTSGTSVSVNAVDGGLASAATLNVSVLSPSPTDFATSVDNRSAMEAAVNTFSNNQGGGNNKPISSYVESSLYMLGQAPVWGKNVSIATAFTNSTESQYNSPLNVFGQCGNNHIIMVTHADSNGEAFSSAVDSLMGNKTCSVTDSGNAWQCAASLADYLHDPTKNSQGVSITTDAIYFGNDASATPAAGSLQSELNTVATSGGGQGLYAANADTLAATLTALIDQITVQNATMTAPGVAVNQLNRLEYLNQLYYSVFKPRNVSVWPGNLKKYQLGGTVEHPLIEDSTGANAIDPSTGFFSQNATSYWNSGVDGNEVFKGGAYEVLQNDQAALTATGSTGYARHLFVTSSAGSSSTIGTSPAATSANPTALTSVKALSDMPSGAGITDAATFDWLMQVWGDPLHSEPQLINYGYSGGSYAAAVADPSLQKNVIFVSDNDGILHAIEANGGHELFAFSPIEELNKDTSRQSISTSGTPLLDPTTHDRTTYGLDGTWTFWRRADVTDASTVASVYAYGGQRRGGNNYFALDVTNMDFTGAGNSVPKFLWQIAPSSAAPFGILGETWSTPQLAKVRINGVDTPVLIFGGGYDSATQDTDGSVSTGDSVGNAIYMVNAYTGALVWYATSTQQGSSSSYGFTAVPSMKWSIPGDPAVVDANGDGYADFIYVGDMGGQIFRVDLNNFNNTGASNLVADVKLVAQLGTSATPNSAAADRRFYAAPVVALGQRNGNSILQLVIGSGYRAHPLSATTQEWAYGIDDGKALAVLQAIKDGTYTGIGSANTDNQPTLTASNLVDVTNLSAGAAVNIDDGTAGLGIYGWELMLDQTVGEKVLSNAAIIQGTALFTTFTNTSTAINACNSVIGGARLYAVNMGTGLAVPNFFSTTSTLNNGRAVNINVPGIPPQPQVLLTNLPHDKGWTPPSNANPLCGMMATSLTGIVGTSAVSLGTVNQCGLQRNGWYQTTQKDVQNLFNSQGAK